MLGHIKRFSDIALLQSFYIIQYMWHCTVCMRGHVVLSLEHLVEKSCKVSENVLCPAVTVSPVIACVNVHNIMMIAINICTHV